MDLVAGSVGIVAMFTTLLSIAIPILFMVWLFRSITSIQMDVERLHNKIDALENLTRDMNRRVP